MKLRLFDMSKLKQIHVQDFWNIKKKNLIKSLLWKIFKSKIKFINQKKSFQIVFIESLEIYQFHTKSVTDWQGRF